MLFQDLLNIATMVANINRHNSMTIHTIFPIFESHLHSILIPSIPNGSHKNPFFISKRTCNYVGYEHWSALDVNGHNFWTNRLIQLILFWIASLFNSSSTNTWWVWQKSILHLQKNVEPCWIPLGNNIPKIATATQQPAQFQPEHQCWLSIASIEVIQPFICPNRWWWHLSKAGTQRYPILDTRNQAMKFWLQNDSCCPQKHHHSFAQYKTMPQATLESL